jgi:hypothetical protein
MDPTMTLKQFVDPDGREFWGINPPKGKVPPHLRKFLFKKGHAGPGKKDGRAKGNPFEKLHFAARTQTAFYDPRTGRFKHAGKPAGKNPAPMMVLGNPPLMMVHGNPKKPGKKPGHNPPSVAGAAPTSLGAFAKTVFSFKWITRGLMLTGGVLADRQLVPRLVEKLPAMFNRVKTGVGYYLTRLTLAAVPAALAVLFKFRALVPWTLLYLLGGWASVAVSGIEAVMVKGGLSALGEVGGETYSVPGNPLGWFGGYRGAMGGYRGRALAGPPEEPAPGTGGYRGSGLSEEEQQQLHGDMEPAY